MSSSGNRFAPLGESSSSRGQKKRARTADQTRQDAPQADPSFGNAPLSTSNLEARPPATLSRKEGMLKDCLLILQMLPWNRSIYHTRLGPSHPPAKRTAENQLYAHANMRRFNKGIARFHQLMAEWEKEEKKKKKKKKKKEEDRRKKVQERSNRLKLVAGPVPSVGGSQGRRKRTASSDEADKSPKRRRLELIGSNPEAGEPATAGSAPVLDTKTKEFNVTTAGTPDSPLIVEEDPYFAPPSFLRQSDIRNPKKPLLCIVRVNNSLTIGSFDENSKKWAFHLTINAGGRQVPDMNMKFSPFSSRSDHTTGLRTDSSKRA